MPGPGEQHRLVYLDELSNAHSSAVYTILAAKKLIPVVTSPERVTCPQSILSLWPRLYAEASAVLKCLLAEDAAAYPQIQLEAKAEPFAEHDSLAA